MFVPNSLCPRVTLRDRFSFFLVGPLHWRVPYERNRGNFKRFLEIGDRLKKVLSNPQGSIEPPFGPQKGSLEPL